MWFLVIVLVGSAIGIAVVLVRNRRPTSMEASISEFERSLQALAPGDEPRGRPDLGRWRDTGTDWG
jgi:hypothetical protein